MLQKATNDGAHADVVRHARALRRQHAAAAHDEINLRALLPCGNQCAYQRLIGQRIHLEHHARPLATGGSSSHLANQLQHAALQMKRRHHQLLQLGQSVVTGEMAKHRIHIGRHFRIAGQLADVGIKPCTACVVVARRQMGVALELVGALFTARNQQHLGVCLEADHAVDHLHAQRFQLLGPVDIGLFIKAGLELQHRQHFLAAAHGLGQQVHDFGVGAGAINRLFDGQHLRVVDGLAQQLQHAIKALKGLVNDDVALAHLRHDGATGRELRGPCGLPFGEQQGRVIHQINQLHLAHQIDRPLDAEQRLRRQTVLLQQQIRQLHRARR